MPTTPGRRHIIPPHMLVEVVRRGMQELRERALASLALDHTERSLRAAVRGRRPRGDTLIASAPSARRAIDDARGTEDLPGKPVRKEGGRASADEAINQAYDGLGATWDFYSQVFGRDSIDGRGLPLLATVHYGQDYDNAFWNGTEMVFGDGDGRVFQGFTACVDVIGHELTHGVTEVEAGLAYFGESGALNESLSDVFGSMVKQKSLGQTADRADWLIGAGLLAPGIDGVALRSLKEPGTAYDDPLLGKDPQPSDYADLYRGRQDNGGVHINSGIPNHAFYLLATALGGRSWDKAGKVWYETLHDVRLQRTAHFLGFAALTADNADRLFGSDVRKAVVAAWRGVGVRIN